MKILAVNPGYVFRDANEQAWRYTISLTIVGGVFYRESVESFSSPSAAKQAMREKVAQERKRHGLGS